MTRFVATHLHSGTGDTTKDCLEDDGDLMVPRKRDSYETKLFVIG